MSDGKDFDVINYADGAFGLAMTLEEARAYKKSEWEHDRMVHIVKIGDETWEDGDE